MCDEFLKRYIDKKFKNKIVYNIKPNDLLCTCAYVNQKIEHIRNTYDLHKRLLYVDINICFLNGLPNVDNTKDVGWCKNNNKFYSDFVYINSLSFIDWWWEIELDSVGKSMDIAENIDIFSNFNFADNVCVTDSNDGMLDKHGIFRHKKYINENVNAVCIDIVIENMFTKTDKYKHIFPMSNPCVTIMTQYYDDPDNERCEEIKYCLEKNIKNKWVKQIIQFNEPETKITDGVICENITKIDVDERLSYKKAIDYANSYLCGELVCITNADIYLDDESRWNTMHQLLDKGKYVYALNRWEYDGNNIYKDATLQQMAYANSQDAWFFVPPLRNMDDIDFLVGTLGCDNAIADRFHRAGYIPINDSDTYRVLHYDTCRKKNGKNFLKFSKEYEKNKNVTNTHPESRGQRLCPAINQIQSIDMLTRNLKLDNYQRYEIICDILSKYLKIRN